MLRFVIAAIVGVVAFTPAMAQQKVSKDTVLIADSGRSYSGRSIDSGSDESSSNSSKAATKAPPKSSSSSQPNPAPDPVGNAVKAGKDVLSIFGR